MISGVTVPRCALRTVQILELPLLLEVVRNGGPPVTFPDMVASLSRERVQLLWKGIC